MNDLASGLVSSGPTPIRIGTDFYQRLGRGFCLYTVRDILTTTNSAGRVVKTEYVADKEYIGGQRLTAKFNAVAVLRGMHPHGDIYQDAVKAGTAIS